MYLKKLYLNNFKNYTELSIDFSEKINGLTGSNGTGKTNLLDSIYYLSFCKSFFNAIDSQNIKHNEEYFMIQGNYIYEDNSYEVLCAQKRNQKKQFKFNQKEYSRLADHIGKLPLVIIAPDDQNLVYGGSDERRKFIDSAISQFDKLYLDDLINYNKVLQQRNSLLKQILDIKKVDRLMFEMYDESLSFLGNKIYTKRKDFLQKFMPVFKERYSNICNAIEIADILYDSQLNESNLKDLIKQNFEKDLILKYTGVGIHKDDLEFNINGTSVRKIASQGQQKSFVVALKFAQFDYIKDSKLLKPLLLLDDVFDKLDENRVQQIINLVADDHFGQVFVTDTHSDRILKVFKNAKVPHKLFKVVENQIEILSE